MTVPGWVDPDPDPREEPDDGGGQAGSEPAQANRPAASGLDDLAEKPVLEWTNEDWALWIDSADGSPLPTSTAASGTPEGEPAASGAPEGELAADASPDEAPAHSGAPAGGVDSVEDAHPAGADARPARLDEEPSEANLTPPEADEIAEPADHEPEPEDPAEAEAGLAEAAEEEDEWAGIADHPWWESAPVVDEVNVLDIDPPTTVEPPVEVGPPVEVTPLLPYPSPPVYSSPRAGPATRATRPMPATRTERAVHRPQAAVPVGSHRVRSAFGLLGVAVIVGMVVAGLITVAVFAISVALRHAVG